MRGTPLTALQPQMADSPTSNLGAATKENLKNRLSRCNFQFPITISEYQTPRQPVFKVFLAVRQAWGTKAVSSSVPVCRSLLRSKPTPEKKQRAQPLHHSKCFACFCHEFSSPNTRLVLCAYIRIYSWFRGTLVSESTTHTYFSRKAAKGAKYWSTPKGKRPTIIVVFL